MNRPSVLHSSQLLLLINYLLYFFILFIYFSGGYFAFNLVVYRYAKNMQLKFL